MARFIFKLSLFFVVALGLSGCGEKGPDRSATKHFKTILSLYVDGKKREYSTVMKITYTRISKSLNGAGGSVDVSGEAIPIDLGRPGKVFMLPSTKSYGNISSDYGTAFKNSFGINVAVGSLKQEHIEKIRNLTGRVPLKNDFYPLIIAFRNKSDPSSLYEVKKNRLHKVFGRNVKFDNVNLEITDEPVTDGEVIKRLPWIKGKDRLRFERAPRGTKIPRSQRPLKWRVNKNDFFVGDNE